jgi:uncharacterized protein DUF3489
MPMLTQASWARGSRPAGDVATVGLRRWRRMCRRNRTDRIMSHSNILTNIRSTTQLKRTAKRRQVSPALRRRRTKQETVLALLKHPKGTTVKTVMQATGWQEHSVRSFFVVIVLKKLGLALSSESIDGARVYRVTDPIASKRARAVA